jgi:hypothetical protein
VPVARLLDQLAQAGNEVAPRRRGLVPRAGAHAGAPQPAQRRLAERLEDVLCTRHRKELDPALELDPANTCATPSSSAWRAHPRRLSIFDRFLVHLATELKFSFWRQNYT